MTGSSQDGREYDPVKLRRLIDTLYDDAISPTEHDELASILSASESAREQFLQDMCLHAGLESEVAANRKLDAIFDVFCDSDGKLCTESTCASVATSQNQRQQRWQVLIVAAAACALVAASTLMLRPVRQFFGVPLAVAEAEPKRSTDETDKPVVATIAALSDECHWMFEKQSIYDRSDGNVRSQIRPGETLRVTSGTLQLTFDHGTAVTLPAPAILEIVSSMRGRLIRGRATVNVALGAEGFTIDTPRTTVIDLGTVFGVEVDDFGRTDVVVFSGIVDVAYSRDSSEPGATDVGTQRLYMGEAVRVDERGTLSRIISLNSNRFGAGRRESVAPTHEPVISSVRDNIDRGDAFNFYEIVPEGMREDAKAFVDRLHHEWNGVDGEGMPPYLVGGDYVKLFNDDKNIGEIEVLVELNQPATLYVLWCDRVPPPKWLTEEFEDTGDKIGVDEGRHVFKDGNVHNRDGPGVGAGVSVDSIHSIWRRVVAKPRTVHLGPTEAPGWDFNVYGIVAVSLPADAR